MTLLLSILASTLTVAFVGFLIVLSFVAIKLKDSLCRYYESMAEGQELLNDSQLADQPRSIQDIYNG